MSSWIATAIRFIAINALSAVAITGCMVGPNFKKPPAPTVTRYTARPLGCRTVCTPQAGNSGKAQYFIAGRDIPAEWWRAFHSPELNNLILTGLANSPTVAAAQAALVQARENVNADIGSAFFPAITGNLSGEREAINSSSIGVTPTTSGGPAINIFNIYNASVSASYTLDVFGGLRRQLEGLVAQEENQRYLLLATYLTLTSNIVTTSVTIASQKAQIQATQELINAETRNLAIIQKQFQLGGVSQTNVLAQLSQLEQTRATLPPLEKSLAQSNHALAVFLGKYPSENQLPKLTLDDLNLPRDLPVSLPSSLVEQRPDILSSGALLHAASAQVGVATANLFPQIQITAGYGWQALSPSTLFAHNTNIWNYGAALTQPLFKGGSLFAQRRAAIAAYNQADAQYRQVVLQAFQNVADSLRAVETDARTLQAQKLAEIATYKSWRMAEKQLRLGGVSYLYVLNAQQLYLQAKINRIQAQAARYNDTAALFQSLGGGWWNVHSGTQYE